MLKNYNLGIFAALVLTLLALVWFHTGSVAPPSGSDAIWFHAGLLTLLIGRFVVEYRFTKPNDVFVNCLVVFASTSTLSSPPNAEWWTALRFGSLALGIAALALAWDPGQERKLEQSRLRAVGYQIVTQLGSAQVLFSFVFVLALISYFDLKSFDTKIFVLVWGGFLVAANLDPSRLVRSATRAGQGRDRRLLGVTHSFLAPSIVFASRVGAERVALHDLVGFAQTANGKCHCLGIVIGERSSAVETRLAIALVGKSVDETQINDRSMIVTVSEDDKVPFQETLDQADFHSIANIIGTVAKGTNISQLRFELFGNPNLATGSLLNVTSGRNAVYYQVFDGVIDEEATLRDSTRAFVEGEAEQIGIWDNARGGFETHDWVARERSAVRLVDQDDAAPEYQLKASEMSVGTIPNSHYQVNVDLNDLVLYHSAILGVTGSGKSFLTFALVEECVRKGIKVVCIDPTGDYQRYLHDAVLLSRQGSLKAFLESPDPGIGIIETAANAQLHPIKQARGAAQVCLDWCKAHRTDQDILNPQPKVLLVLEEAHLLAPEWNFNPERGLQDQVSATSQIVLQARKYGLGFLVVSQRTANVVKSILNQCNTMISFQAFDETGFEFLKNYMGSFHVGSLPNLKLRHGILVGKASRSRRPVMVHFTEQQRAVRAGAAPEMPLPGDAPQQAAEPEEAPAGGAAE